MTYLTMYFELVVFLFGKRDKLDVGMFWQSWLLFLCQFGCFTSVCEKKGLCFLDVIPFLSFCHIN